MLLLAEACFLAPIVRGSTGLPLRGLQPVAVRIPACFHGIIRAARRQTKPRSLATAAGTAVSVAADRNKQNIHPREQCQIFTATKQSVFCPDGGIVIVFTIYRGKAAGGGVEFHQSAASQPGYTNPRQADTPIPPTCIRRRRILMAGLSRAADL